jgi:phage portal protein BeeE
LPLVNRVVAAVSDWVSDYSGHGMLLKPDLDQLTALAPEREAQWRRIGEATFLSDLEKRSLLGLPVLDLKINE